MTPLGCFGPCSEFVLALCSRCVALQRVMAQSLVCSADKTLLLLTFPGFTHFQYLLPLVVNATKATRRRLVIVLFSRIFDENLISHADHWHDIQRLLTFIYVQASKVAQDAGRLLMEVDVLLKGVMDKLPDGLIEDVGMVYRASGGQLSKTP